MYVYNMSTTTTNILHYCMYFSANVTNVPFPEVVNETAGL